MRKILVLLVYVVSTLPVVAQKADKVMDAAVKTLQQSGGIEAQFTYAVSKDAKTEAVGEGTLQLKGEQYHLTLGDDITWCNGEHVWSYRHNNEEVYVSEPAGDDPYNIYALLSLHKQGYRSSTGATRTWKGHQVTEVILSGTHKDDAFKRLVIYFNKAFQPVYIHAQPHDGYVTEISIVNYRTGIDLPDRTFVFDKTKYPQAEIIEL